MYISMIESESYTGTHFELSWSSTIQNMPTNWLYEYVCGTQLSVNNIGMYENSS